MRRAMKFLEEEARQSLAARRQMRRWSMCMYIRQLIESRVTLMEAAVKTYRIGKVKKVGG